MKEYIVVVDSAYELLGKIVHGTIVRCEDCKQSGIDSTSYPQYWCSAHSEYHKADYFCADGERRTE